MVNITIQTVLDTIGNNLTMKTTIATESEDGNRPRSRLSKRQSSFDVVLEALGQRNMEEPSVRSTKRASSESSLIRLRRKDKAYFSKPHDFPTVANAVKHFQRKANEPEVVAVSVPLNKRSSFLDNGDETKLKYHHRSVDEMEKMSQNSERLRTVFDEEIDLDYIDIVYEANKPSKDRFVTLSCGHPLMPKHVSRTIKLQQRSESRGACGKDQSDEELEQDFKHNFQEVTKSEDERNMVDLKTRSSVNTSNSVNIEFLTNSSKPPENRLYNQLPRPQHRPDFLSSAHRVSYFRKSNGFIGSVNRANTRDMQKILRYSKYVNQAFRVKHNNV